MLLYPTYQSRTRRKPTRRSNAHVGQAISVLVGVTVAGDIENIVQSTTNAFGALNCAFNNAGIAAYQIEAVGQNTADWLEDPLDRMIAVNLKGVWLCMRAEKAHGGEWRWSHCQYSICRWSYRYTDIFILHSRQALGCRPDQDRNVVAGRRNFEAGALSANGRTVRNRRDGVLAMLGPRILRVGRRPQCRWWIRGAIG